ncbi:MAG: TonB-dependent receptor [Novosphingobium sp.]
MPQSAMAQASPQSSTEASAQGGDIIVTARKRDESLQDVPISISAIGDAELAKKGVTQLRNLEYSVPGVTFTDQGSAFGGFGIRGIFTLVRNGGIESGVGVYVDGVYQGRNSSSNSDIFDVANVQVLKGPQGTLFGRNTVSGAISITTKAPTNDFEGSVKVSAGNLDMRSASAMLSGPIVKDKLLVRVSGSLVKRDGYTLNLYDGKKLDSQDRLGGRMRLRYLATDDLTFDLEVDGARDRGLVNRGGYLISGAQGSSYNPAAEYAQLSDPRVTSVDNFGLGSYEHRDVWGASLNAEYKFGDGFALTSTTAYRDGSFTTASDFDGTASDISGGYTSSSSKQFTQELRLATPTATGTGFAGDAFDVVVGAFYIHQDTDGVLASQLGTGCTELTCPIFAAPVTFGPTSRIRTNSVAGYASLNWRVVDGLTLTGGLRYTWEQKKLDFRQAGAPAIGIPTIPQTFMKRHENNLSPTLSAVYKVTPDISLYGTVSRGYKSGGFNADAVANLDIEFGAEKVTNYEAGFKTSLFDRRVTFNASVYYQDYSDLQVQQFVGAVQQVTNAASANIYGAEVELNAKVTDRLTLNGSFSRIDAKFADFPNATRAGENFKGNYLPSAPKYTADFSAEYTMPMGDSADAFVRGNWSYRGAQYFQANNAAFTYQRGYSLFGARVGLNLQDGKYQIAAFADNIGDKLYATNRLPFLGTQMGFWGAPRTYGVEATAKF